MSRPSAEQLADAKWWTARGLEEANAISEPNRRAGALMNLLGAMCDVGDYAGVSAAADALNAVKAVTTVDAFGEPDRMLAKAKIMQAATAGNLDAAFAAIAQAPEGVRSSHAIEVVQALARDGNADALKTALAKGALGKGATGCAVGSLLSIAARRGDADAARAALASLPDDSSRAQVVSPLVYAEQVAYSFGRRDAADAKRLALLVVLLPSGPNRSSAAFGALQTLVRHGWIDEAIICLPAVSDEQLRTTAMQQVATSLAAAGRTEDARKLVADANSVKVVAANAHGVSLGLAVRGDLAGAQEERRRIGSRAPSNDWATQFTAAVARGQLMHDQVKAGLDGLRSIKDTQERNRVIRETVGELTESRNFELAGQVIGLIEGEKYMDLYERGYQWREIALAALQAGDSKAIQTALDAIRALLPRVQAKEKTEATASAAGIFAECGQVGGGLAMVAGLPTERDRNIARGGIASTCARVGDIAGIQQVAAAWEGTTPMRLQDLASQAAETGHLKDLPSWIARWPLPEDRADAAVFVARKIRSSATK